MNKYEEFYQSIKGDAQYLEFRIFQPNGYIFSEYIENIEDIKQLLEQNKKNNCYVGINPRKNKGRKNIDVAYRRSIIFDIEMIGDKLPLTNKIYQEKLNRTVACAEKYMKDKFKFSCTWSIISGRGIHLYFLVKPLDMDYQKYFNTFYTTIMTEINKLLPDKDMKLDKMLKDSPRIASAPGTHNTKYPEKSAFRKIMKSNPEAVNDLKPILDIVKLKTKSVKRTTNKPITGSKCSIKTIYKKPEFKIFTYKDLPKGSINNRLRMALKLLMKLNNFTYEETEEVAYKIADQGYPYKSMNMSDEYSYEYSKQIINNWTLEEYSWCLTNNFKLPYPLSYKCDTDGYNEKDIFDWDSEDMTMKNFERFNDVIEYTSAFNLEHTVNYNDMNVYKASALEYNLKNKCVPKLWEFIEENKLFEKIKHVMRTKENIHDVSEWMV